MSNPRYTTASRGGQMASPRPKTRDNKDTICRNVLIYGHCRYEDQGCAFNHDQNKNNGNNSDKESACLSSNPHGSGHDAQYGETSGLQPTQSRWPPPPNPRSRPKRSYGKGYRPFKEQAAPDTGPACGPEHFPSLDEAATVPKQKAQGKAQNKSKPHDNKPHDEVQNIYKSRKEMRRRRASTPANFGQVNCQDSKSAATCGIDGSAALQPRRSLSYAAAARLPVAGASHLPCLMTPPSSTPTTVHSSTPSATPSPRSCTARPIHQPQVSPNPLSPSSDSQTPPLVEYKRSAKFQAPFFDTNLYFDDVPICYRGYGSSSIPPSPQEYICNYPIDLWHGSYTSHSNDQFRAAASPSLFDSGAMGTLLDCFPSVRHERYPAESAANRMPTHSSKKTLNVDSPSFTPAVLPGVGGKKSTFSTNATPFTPRGAPSAANPTLQQDASNTAYKAAPFSDFTPGNYDLNTATAANGSTDASQLNYDPFSMSGVAQSLPAAAQFNPYAEDHAGLAGTSGAMFAAAQNAFTAPLQPLSYHLYYPITPVREPLQPYQRQAHEFFLPEQTREELQKKSEAARQVMSTPMQLPSPAHYHSLVPLDTKPKPTLGFFGFVSWVYKAFSRKMGSVYCLRRIEGFRLTNEDAFVRNVASWKKISHPNVVTVVEAFTTRDFGDSSLVFAHHYHPLSKTLAEHHFSATRYARGPTAVPEKVLWSYIVQIASALRTIHQASLAARCIDMSKIIITDKNHVRLSGCSIVDVIQNDAQRPLEQLQQDDFIQLGKLILGIATTTLPVNMRDLGSLVDQLGRTYSQELKDRVTWLLSPPQPSMQKNADSLLWYLSSHTTEMLEDSMRVKDDTTIQLSRELENGRLFRLLAKLGTINERPEFDGDPSWSETSERYTLKLFRDYVFHQVDNQGNPVVDMGHIVTCLNKLDAGIDEKVYLTSRDHQSAFIVSYKELKKQVNTAFGDLLKAASSTNSSKTQPPGRTF